MWGGHYAFGPADAFAAINPSIAVDKRLYAEDIQGSLAHAQMLAKVGILNKSELKDIERGLAHDGVLPGGLKVRRRAPELSVFVTGLVTRKMPCQPTNWVRCRVRSALHGAPGCHRAGSAAEAPAGSTGPSS